MDNLEKLLNTCKPYLLKNFDETAENGSWKDESLIQLLDGIEENLVDLNSNLLINEDMQEMIKHASECALGSLFVIEKLHEMLN